MKIVDVQLAAHLAGEVTTLAVCWKLTRRDGVTLGFTDHDRDIVLDAVTYKASSGFTPSAIVNSGTLNVDNLDVEGMLSDSGITEQDIFAGVYDFAAIDIFSVNYMNTSQGVLKLRRGWLGEVSFYKQQFVAEVRGLTQRLSQTIGELYSVSCRATLGDARCKIHLPDHMVSGIVGSSSARQIIIDTMRSEASGSFTFGILNFTSGANNGLSMEVKEYLYNGTSGGEIVLALPMPYAIGPGDTYQLSKGCDKTTATCHGRFNNIINFRGEPSVPGLDRMLETAGTRTIS